MNDILNDHTLIGLGEFSHGIQESWNYRFAFLKYAMETSNKKITIFSEMSRWQSDNIMNNTYFDMSKNKFIKDANIHIEQPKHDKKDESPWGKLWQYCYHSMESKIFVKIIKYIRKHKNRITIIGIDNEKLNRDYDMAKIILNNLNHTNINFFWAHNSHVDDRLIEWFDYKWIKDDKPNMKFRCGHYLKKKLGNKYCIILTQAYRGTIRFNSWCEGDGCSTRIWTLKYFTKSFKYDKNKKYVTVPRLQSLRTLRLLDAPKDTSQSVTVPDPALTGSELLGGSENRVTDNPTILLSKFNTKMIEFSNSYFSDNKYGECSISNSNNWNYVLFFNSVTSLEHF